MALAKQMGDRKQQAHFLYRMSRIDRDDAQYETALRESQQSLQLCRELGDHLGEIYIQDYLGQIYAQLGKEAEAQQAWSDALSLAEAMNHPLVEVLRHRLKS